MSFTVSVRANLKGKIDFLASDAAKKAVAATTQAKKYAETEFKARISQQIALPTNRVNELVETKQIGATAELIAKDTPVRLSEYPHKPSLNAVDVQINPGQVTRIPGARITRDGQIVLYQSGGRFELLHGPGVDQIAATEFDDIGQKARKVLLRAMK